MMLTSRRKLLRAPNGFWIVCAGVGALMVAGCNQVSKSGHQTNVRNFPDPETNHYRYKIEPPAGVPIPDGMTVPLTGIVDINHGLDGEKHKFSLSIAGKQYGSMTAQSDGFVTASDKDSISPQDFYIHLPPPGIQPTTIGLTYVDLPPYLGRIIENHNAGVETAAVEATNIVQSSSAVGDLSLVTLSVTGKQKLFHYDDATGGVRSILLTKAFDGSATLLGSPATGWRVYSFVHYIQMGNDGTHVLRFSVCLYSSSALTGNAINSARSQAGCDWVK